MRVFFVLADSLRADALSFAGGAAATPFVDAMAREGAAAPLAFSCSPWTVPSVASTMTGAWAHRLGLYRWEQPWPDGSPSLFDAFGKAGARVTSFVFDEAHLFRAVPAARVAGSSQDLQGVIDAVARCADRDLFCFVHYWGTHFPYLDRPMTMRAWKALADRVVAAMNDDPAAVRPKVQRLYERAVSRFSERFLPLLARAASLHGGPGGNLFVVTSDHGESWGERLARGAPLRDVFDLHGNHLFDEALRVPLLFHCPGRVPPSSPGGIVRTVDIAPTVARLCGLDWQGGDGEALDLERPGDAPAAGRVALAAASADFVDGRAAPASPGDLWVELAARSERWKLAWRPAEGTRTVFDLAADPGELRPLPEGSGEDPSLWRLLEAERARCALSPPPDGAGRRLGEMGYVEE